MNCRLKQPTMSRCRHARHQLWPRLRGAPPRSGGRHEWWHHDLIRVCGHDLLLRCQILLDLLAILRAPWLRAALIWWMGWLFGWKVLHRRSGHVGCGRRRRMGVGCGLPAWIGEAEQREGGSPAVLQDILCCISHGWLQ